MATVRAIICSKNLLKQRFLDDISPDKYHLVGFKKNEMMRIFVANGNKSFTSRTFKKPYGKPIYNFVRKALKKKIAKKRG